MAKTGAGDKQGRRVNFLMDNFTESQLEEIRAFFGINQTRAFEVAIDFLHDEVKARKARGEAVVAMKVADRVTNGGRNDPAENFGG